jgi:hypothetical protein
MSSKFHAVFPRFPKVMQELTDSGLNPRQAFNYEQIARVAYQQAYAHAMTDLLKVLATDKPTLMDVLNFTDSRLKDLKEVLGCN